MKEQDAISQAAAIAAASAAAAIVSNDIAYIKSDISEIKSSIKEISGQYITRSEFHAEFNPVRSIVYGLIGVLGVATVGAILRLIFIH